MISGLGLLQLLVVLEIVLGFLINFHPYSRPLCLATQVSIIEDSACRVRIILTCLLNTKDIVHVVFSMYQNQN